MNNPAMAGPGDAATWPPYTGHPNDPRRRPGFSGSITDRVRVGVANLQVIASIEYDDGDVIDTQVKTLERMDISGYLSIETLEDIARQIGTKHGV